MRRRRPRAGHAPRGGPARHTARMARTSAPRLRYAAALGAVLGWGLGLTACTTTTGDPGVLGPSSTTGTAWRREAVPAGTAPVVLAAYRNGLLLGAARPVDSTAATSSPVGAADDEIHRAGLATAVRPEVYTHQGGRWSALSVQAASGYGAEATWSTLHVSADGSIVAVGGARGGAHANVRWSVWRGDVTSGLREQPQEFTVFGGWGAGDQGGIVEAGGIPLLFGSWGGQAGLDIAVWRPDGDRWVRQPSEGTDMGSTATRLVSAAGGTGWGPGAVLVGSVLHLGESLRQTPALFRSASADGPWTALDLPGSADASPGSSGGSPGGSSGGSSGGAASGGANEALSVGCLPQQDCVVAGRVAGRLVLWRVGIDGRTDPIPGLPSLALPERGGVPAVLRDTPGADAVVLATGSGRSGSVLLFGSATDRWTSVMGPPGQARALVLAEGRWWALSEVDGVVSLWSLPT